MRAFLFPGQGSQYSGMGKDFAIYPRAYFFFERAKDVLGIDMYRLMNENEETLKLTENAQPAIYLASYIAFDELMRNGYVPSILAGHSLGEYTALAAADVYDFELGLYLVRKRGEYISQAVIPGEGTMAAIIGLKYEEVERQITNLQGVWIANHNAEDQVVISGLKNSVITAMELLKRKAKRVVELKVSGPFHTPLLESAKEKMAREIKDVKFRKPRWPIVMNCTGNQTTDPEEIKNYVLEQITSAVLWHDSICNMTKTNVSGFVEVGPGKVLTNLLRRSTTLPCKHFTEIIMQESKLEAVQV